ncbi:hypothetical protein MM300_10555 [Evansella sp. LMS18]|uniref:hypothetical protein n=1 Tax=Evansella sp. LMS18 TaxID=2924033 RepID=UPI0020D1B4CB|nr:hypothetical protein [Evansella sp. LMS18]UTR12675.1 hypothetical protein MM300_10555 [Evansella sp. LMS18]
MKTYSILFIITALMHLVTLVNITFFDGEWNGIALFLSSMLFLTAAVYFGIERRAHKRAGSHT